LKNIRLIALFGFKATYPLGPLAKGGTSMERLLNKLIKVIRAIILNKKFWNTVQARPLNYVVFAIIMLITIVLSSVYIMIIIASL